MLAFVLLFIFFFAIGPQEATTRGRRDREGLPGRGRARSRATGSSPSTASAATRTTLSKQIAAAPLRRQSRRRRAARPATPATLVVERDGASARFELTPVYDADRGASATRLGFGYAADGPRETLPVRRGGRRRRRPLLVHHQGDARAARAADRPRAAQGDLGRRRLLRGHAPDDPRRRRATWSAILAIISLSLAIVNLFPFLPLDGGHIFWAIVEKVRRQAGARSRSWSARAWSGFMLVIVIFLIGLSNDIGRLSGEGFQVSLDSAHGAVTTDTPHRSGRPGLDASTLAEAFQLTAAAHPDRVALRTKGDEFSITWARVRGQGARAWPPAWPALGLERGDTIGADAHEPARVPLVRRRGACTSAPRRSRSTTPTRAEQIEYQVQRRRGAHRRHRAGVPRPRRGELEGDRARDRRRRRADEAMTLDDVEAGRDGLRLRGRLARRRAGRRAHADLHVGHHRAAEGRAAHAREPDRGRAAASTR